jgi:steroid 5-alpha reductase family enzyme
MNFQGLLVLFIVALIFCSVGFYKFVYFMSVGYGLAVAAIGVTLLVFGFNDYSTMGIVLGSVLMIVYGFRLAGFLMYRELKNGAYKKVLADASTGTTTLSFPIKVLMWGGMALLYVLQTSPLFFRLDNMVNDNTFIYAGCAISALGIVIETLADIQKSNQKKVRSDMVATKGLYSVVRCPNYLGEILFWTGVFVEGITAYANILQFIFSFVGYILILYVMVDSAKRLEIKQNKNYGSKDEYWEYANNTPILFAFIPLYHLSKVED